MPDDTRSSCRRIGAYKSNTVLMVIFLVLATYASVNNIFGSLPLLNKWSAALENEATYIGSIDETALTTTGKKHRIATDAATTTHAVVHIGPHKTGTTSIQEWSRRLVTELREDGYEMPWTNVNVSEHSLSDGAIYTGWNAANFAHCFQRADYPLRTRYPCLPALARAGEEIAARRKSILISSEEFDRFTADAINELKRYLTAGWDKIAIVAYYRRYYDWLRSQHNQISKTKTGNVTAALGIFRANRTERILRSPINVFLRRVSQNRDYNDTQRNFETMFSRTLAFKSAFPENLLIMNYYNTTTDLSQAFYCDAVPNARNACRAIREQIADDPVLANAGIHLVYEDIAYRAHRLGLINVRTQEHYYKALEMIRHHQEQTLGLSPYGFTLQCPGKPVLTYLLKKTLLFERRMVPRLFESPDGEKSLRKDFRKQAKTSLCQVDVVKTVDTPKWRRFFESMKLDS